MPTVLRVGPYRIYFYSADGFEPPHVHVERDQNRAKVWLQPVRLHDSTGFGRQELNRIVTLVNEYRDHLLSAWNEFFGT
jgi:hypothetical protein